MALLCSSVVEMLTKSFNAQASQVPRQKVLQAFPEAETQGVSGLVGGHAISSSVAPCSSFTRVLPV